MITDKLGDITLYNADCMDILRELPDNAFSIAVVDPPYGDANFQIPPHQAMNPDGGRQIQTTDGIGSEEDSTVTREPSRLRALTGRFERYQRSTPIGIR